MNHPYDGLSQDEAAGKFNLRVDLKKFVRLMPFICEDETRYMIHAIGIRPLENGGVVMAATNGRQLAFYRDLTGICPDSGMILKPCLLYTSPSPRDS